MTTPTPRRELLIAFDSIFLMVGLIAVALFLLHASINGLLFRFAGAQMLDTWHDIEAKLSRFRVFLTITIIGTVSLVGWIISRIAMLSPTLNIRENIFLLIGLVAASLLAVIILSVNYPAHEGRGL